ncbi:MULTISPECIES: LysR family transcriptional regulator [unclassified Lactobacillus]|uniref:LysR family transcriptional regulator n=1 Tax=unclassified Lactobacillus TaxID=2620435 RepID=UPI0023F7D9E2|nr:MULTISPECIES: LysR family transcriptional regulator [unclassified Lactobacillus]WEV36821.1 LysR family transcriptional regulator [Lactobacillus sp. ESL0677]WEV50947.1 LysR family transcriptional regulator [Lactobacillus sp. ESL0700]WEV62078.1 LysR family transcriptional regulator [Lactobacillus sp. ESL0731]
MNFTQLHCFVKAVDNSSFTIAAEALNFTQPAVSKNIKDLENELEVTLINRGHHRISLTNAGKYFYKVARNVVDDMDYASEYLKSQKNKVGDLIRIGFSNTPLEQRLMPLVLQKLHRADSKLEIQLVDILTNTVSVLLNHRVDVCVISRDSIDVVGDVKFETLIPGGFVVACPAGSPLSEQEKITLADLKDQKLFMFDPNNSFSFQMQNSLIAQIGLEHIRFVQDFFTMGIYVKANFGLGILPNFIADFENKDVVYVPLDYAGIPPYGLAYIGSVAKDVDISKIIQVFKDAIKATVNN